VIVGLVLLAVSTLASLGGAWTLTSTFRSDRPGINAVLFLLFHLAIVSTTVLVAGVAGFLHPLPLGIAGVVALGLLRWKGVPIPRFEWAALDRGLLAAGALVAVKLLVHVWMLAPNIPDAITYHLPKVAEWTRAGRITTELGLDPRTPFPAGFELVELWWVVFLHHDVIVELAGVEFLLLAAAATYALARRLGLAARPAGYAALLYAVVPGVSLQAVSCLNDLPVAALVLASFALVAARMPLPFLFVAAGLGCGIKPTFAFALPGIVLMEVLSRKEARSVCTSPRTAWALAAVVLLVGSFWYGRNTVLFGNPIYPVGSEGYVNRKGLVGQQTGPRLSSLAANFSALVSDRVLDRTSPYSGVMVNIAAWGGVAFACGAAALLLQLREPGPYRRLALGFLVSMASIFLFVLPDAWSMRFVLYFPALLVIATAAVCVENRCVAWVAALGAVLQFVCTLVPGDLYPGQLRDLWQQGWRTRANALMPWIEAPGDAVGVFQNGGAMEYLLFRPDYSRRVVRLRGKSVEEVAETLDREKVRLVWCFPPTPLLQDCLRRGLLRHLNDGFFLRR